jgi:hypothetical protein
VDWWGDQETRFSSSGRNCRRKHDDRTQFRLFFFLSTAPVRLPSRCRTPRSTHLDFPPHDRFLLPRYSFLAPAIVNGEPPPFPPNPVPVRQLRRSLGRIHEIEPTRRSGQNETRRRSVDVSSSQRGQRQVGQRKIRLSERRRKMEGRVEGRSLRLAPHSLSSNRIHLVVVSKLALRSSVPSRRFR